MSVAISIYYRATCRKTEEAEKKERKLANYWYRTSTVGRTDMTGQEQGGGETTRYKGQEGGRVGRRLGERGRRSELGRLESGTHD